jgi:hypothetical protein
MKAMNGSSTRKRLERLLAHYEGAASAIRTTLSLLDGDERASAARNGHGVIAQAMKLDAARAEAHDDDHRPKYVSKIKAQRARTAAILKGLSRTEPGRVKDPKSVAVMVRHGYIRRQGDGYVRTEKVFRP